MKKLLVCILSLATASLVWGQTGSKPKPSTAKPAAAKPATTKPAAKPSVIFKSHTDSLSYALGVGVGSFYKQQGITNVNTSILAAAVKDILDGKTLALDEAHCSTIMQKLTQDIQEKEAKNQAAQMQQQEAQAKPNIDSGNAFLARNKQRPEVKTTASGLQYEVVKEGNGVHPTAQDTVVCNYKGTLINGTEFDNSYTRGEPISFPLNRVIPGWTEGVQLMSVGATYKLYIPYNLAYGAGGSGPIPGGSTLVFQVDLLDIKKAGHN